MTTTTTTTRFVAVLQHAVIDRLPMTGLLSVLMVGTGLLTGSLWPSLRGTLSDLPPELTDGLGKALAGADLTTASGWATAEMVSVVAPLAVIAAAVVVGRGVVGEEGDKTLGVLLSVPLTRRTFLLAKAGAMTVHAVAVAVAVAVGLAAGSVVGDMDLSPVGVLAVGLHVAALGVLVGAVALLVGALGGGSRTTTATAAGVAGAALLATAVLPLFESAAAYVRLSPWYYFNASEPLTNGPDWAHLLVLLATAAALVAAAAAAYQRRDLRG